MASTVTVYVDPDASGAGNGTSWANAYTSLDTAQDTEAKDLTSSDEIYVFLCRSSGGTADTVRVDLDTAWKCDTTRYIVFRANDGDQAIKTGWSATRYRLSVTDDYALVMANYGSNAHVLYIGGLQIESVYSSSTYKDAISSGAAVYGSYLNINQTRIRVNNNTYRGIRVSDADLTLDVLCTIVHGTSYRGISVNNNVTQIYNCCVTDAYYDGIHIEADATATVKNCAVFNNADDFDDAAASTIDYCASDDGDGTNAVAAFDGDWDNEFNDPTNGDFTLLNSGNCYQGGTDNPGAGLYTVDIEDDAFATPWDIGVDAYVAAGGVSIAAIQLLRNMNILG